jgi:hypothetical protein
MKQFVRSWLILTFAAALAASSSSALAQKKLPPGIRHLDTPTYSVTLTSTPANQSSITLTARVTVSSGATSARVPGTLVVDNRLRYTFKAQRTWPCADTITIAENITQPTVTWNKAGEYTGFTVHVTTVQTTPPPVLPAVLGDGTLSSPVTVTPTGGVATTWDVFPPAGSTGPVQASVKISANFPPEFTQYRFKITCAANCQPASGTQALGTTSSYPFSTTIAPGGGQQLYAYVDQVHMPDCQWVGSIQAYKFDYWVKP